MDEYEFEEFVADIWAKRGWQTTVTSGSNDRGIDVIARKRAPFERKQRIRAERYAENNKTGSPDIQQCSGLKRQERGTTGTLVLPETESAVLARSESRQRTRPT